MLDTIMLFIAQVLFSIFDYLNTGTNSLTVVVAMFTLASVASVCNIIYIMCNQRQG